MAQSVIIIGAGMGGLAAGIYGQINGFRTRIFEMLLQLSGNAITLQIDANDGRCVCTSRYPTRAA